MPEVGDGFILYKLKHLLAKPLLYGASESGIPYNNNLPRYIRITDISLDGRLKDNEKLSLSYESANGYILNDKDILLARSGATVGKAFLYKKEYGSCAFAGYLIKASLNPKLITPEFLFYYTQCSIYEEWKNQIFVQATIQNIGADKYSELHIPVPSLIKQQDIITFLDRKCADIDNVLEKTKASIEEYKILKQAVITEAVTKGIRGKRPMKDSGSIWFGQIPDTWDANKLKYTFTIRKRIVGEDGHTVLAITQKGIKPKDMSNGNGQFAESYANYQIVHPGDFAMNHMDLLTGWVDISQFEGVTSPDYRVFTLDDTTRNCLGYYLYMMQMCYSNRIFYSMGQGVSGMGRWRLPANMFNNFLIPVPPYDEQKEIADYLNTKCAERDNLISSKEKFISELGIYKKSLIHEYVTGKKEVPTIVKI